MSMLISSSVEVVAGLKKRVLITLPSASMEPLYDERLRELARKATVHGFRPGKVPVSVVESKVAGGLLFEIAQELIKKQWPDIIAEHHLRVVGTPELVPLEMDHIRRGHDMLFSIECEVYPDVVLPDFSSISLNHYIVTVTEQDVEVELGLLQRSCAEWQEVDRPVAAGDRVAVEFMTYRLDAAGNRTVFTPASHVKINIDLDECAFKMPFGVLQQALLGARIGDEREVQIAIPIKNDVQRTVEVLVTLKITSISTAILPPVDDLLAPRLHKRATDVASLRSLLIKQMQLRGDRALHNHMKFEVIRALLDRCFFEVPSSLVEPEAEDEHLKEEDEWIRTALGAQLSRTDIALSLSGSVYNTGSDRLRAGLILSEVIQHYELRLQDHHIEAEVEKMATLIGEDFAQLFSAYSKKSHILDEIGMAILENLAIDKIVEGASLSEERIEYRDVVTGQYARKYKNITKEGAV